MVKKNIFKSVEISVGELVFTSQKILMYYWKETNVEKKL